MTDLKLFRIKENNSTIRQEIIGGTTTFMTMAYILFVQPAVMHAAGMDFGAVLLATCLSSAFAILVMGLYANYPIALAPGMGQNIFFTYTVVLTMGIPWQKALGVVFIAGVIFVILSFFGFREKIINAIPNSLKFAIAVGIGFMITLIGLEWGGLVVDDPNLLITLGDFSRSDTQLTLAGLLITSVMLVRKVPGAMLIGIIVTTLLGFVTGLVQYHGVFSAPPAIEPTLFKLDLAGVLDPDYFALIFTFLILDLFDTIGTLIGVAGPAGMLKNGNLPGAEKALLADAIGTVAGALLGTSTVTSYVESAAGVASGARTGLANMVTAGFFLLAIFLYPLVAMVGSAVEMGEGIRTYPTIAPVLILVGVFMIRSIGKIKWEDLSESIPAFLTIVFILFSFRITEGIALGFIAFVILKLFSGKVREIPLMLWIFSVIFILRYAFMMIK